MYHEQKTNQHVPHVRVEELNNHFFGTTNILPWANKKTITKHKNKNKNKMQGAGGRKRVRYSSKSTKIPCIISYARKGATGHHHNVEEINHSKKK